MPLQTGRQREVAGSEIGVTCMCLPVMKPMRKQKRMINVRLLASQKMSLILAGIQQVCRLQIRKANAGGYSACKLECAMLGL